MVEKNSRLKPKHKNRPSMRLYVTTRGRTDADARRLVRGRPGVYRRRAQDFSGIA